MAVGTAFDGTYQVAFSTKVNQMYTSSKGHMAPCADWKPGSLTISHGRARYTAEAGYQVTGNVSPNGELEMRHYSVGVGASPSLDAHNSDTNPWQKQE